MAKSYFSTDELSCPCGLCMWKKPPMSPVFMSMINQARATAGIPFAVNSAYRCPEHNVEVGGKATSSHIFGMAMDIACSNSRDRFLIVAALIKAGFNRIGIAKTFIHADIDGTKDREVVWLY